jgi:hypothetical protein
MESGVKRKMAIAPSKLGWLIFREWQSVMRPFGDAERSIS